MKTKNIAVWLTGACMAWGLAACTADFEDANRPGNKTSLEELGRDDYAVSSFITELQNLAFPEQENLYQNTQDLIGNYLGRYMTYVNAAFSVKNYACFNAPDNWKIVPWRDGFAKGTSSFNQVAHVTGKQGPMYALALILRAQLMLRFTDTYGPLPVGLEEDPNAYSSQEKVYDHLLATIDEAVGILQPLLDQDPNLVLKKEADHVYGGEMKKWVRFAHSLKLRMAIRMRFVDAQKAQQIAEAAYKAGVIEKNEDNCEITYIPNGQYKTSVEWGDSRACADIDSYMNGYQDPRMYQYFANAEEWAGRSLVGCRAGANVTNKEIATKKYSAARIQKESKGMWMTAAEMTFCRAEGAMLGWSMGGGESDLYEKAIRLSFEQWGVNWGVEEYLNSEKKPQYYNDVPGGFGANHAAASQITVKWNPLATKEEKMERLIVQKWIALFPDGQEAWNEIRRTGFPKVFPVAQATSGYDLQVPNRVPFDPREVTGTNKENYRKAVEMLGGQDDYAAKMWWQQKK